MTTYAEIQQRETAGWPLYAALGTGLSLVLTAVGTFFDLTGNDEGSAEPGEWFVVAAITLVAAALVFGLVVRTASRGNAGRRALILASLSVPSIVVFWAGLPGVLALGAIGCAMASRRADGSLSTAARVAIPIAVVVIGCACFLAIAG